MTRVALFGDPTKALGTVAEAECARVVAALDLAEKLSAPVEWSALSSGATVRCRWHRDIGLGVPYARRIITFTQSGGEISTSSSRASTPGARPVLERRSDDADGRQGHSGHDAGQRDGAQPGTDVLGTPVECRPRTTSASVAMTG